MGEKTCMYFIIILLGGKKSNFINEFKLNRVTI